MFDRIKKTLISCALVGAVTSAAAAQTQIDASSSDATIRNIARVIADEFYDADRAASISQSLLQDLDAGGFSDLSDAESLASTLTARLVEEDRHFSVRYIGVSEAQTMIARREARDRARANGERPAQPRDRWAGLRRQNFGFQEVRILPGNIGYIDLRMFAPIAPAMDTAIAALELIENTDGVIIDVRNNGGGSPDMVQFLVSYFLEPGGETLINTFVSRDYEYPNQMWSLPAHPAGHRPDVPLMVLTSGRTGSAGEGFPYHLQALERATIIGRSTYGGGNPGQTFILESGFAVFVSTGSARNPITGTNWEGTGVTPDIDVASEDALDQALLRLHGTLAEAAENEAIRRSHAWAAERLTAELEPVELDQAQLERYAGDYGIRRLFLEGDALMYQRQGQPAQPLIALGDDRFAFPDSHQYRVTFRFEDGDAASAMVLLTDDGNEMVNPRGG